MTWLWQVGGARRQVHALLRWHFSNRLVVRSCFCSMLQAQEMLAYTTHTFLSCCLTALAKSARQSCLYCL